LPGPIRTLQTPCQFPEKVIPVLVQDGIPAPLNGTADMTCIVVDEKHLLPFPVQELQDIVEMAAVVFAFSHVIAVEDEIESAVEAELDIDLIEPVCLIAQDPHCEPPAFEPLHLFKHPWAQREAIDNFDSQDLIGSPDTRLAAKGIPPAALPRLSREVACFDDQLVALQNEALLGQPVDLADGRKAVPKPLVGKDPSKIEKNRVNGPAIQGRRHVFPFLLNRYYSGGMRQQLKKPGGSPGFLIPGGGAGT
jgi:hypothetical protein